MRCASSAEALDRQRAVAPPARAVRQDATASPCGRPQRGASDIAAGPYPALHEVVDAILDVLEADEMAGAVRCRVGARLAPMRMCVVVADASPGLASPSF